MLSNCSSGEDSWESLGLQGDQKKINPKHSLEGPMLKLKLQYFGHLMQRANSLEKTLLLGKIESMRRRRQQKIRWLDGITDSVEMNLSKLLEMWRTGKPGMLQSMGSQRVRHCLATEQQLLLGISKKITLGPRLLSQYHWRSLITGVGFPGGSDSKASACNAGDPGFIPGLEGSPGEGNGNRLHYSCQEYSMDREAWWTTVHGVTKSQTRLST